MEWSNLSIGLTMHPRGPVMYPGIDYGLGKTNIDLETGIRYGIIPANSLDGWFWDNVESVYEPQCPHCGAELEDDFESPEDCPFCYEYIDDGEQYGDEPNFLRLTGDYEGFVDSSNDVIITKSPYYTHAQFCSPCAPGAGYLLNYCKGGPKTYCFGPDEFDNGIPPYPVYVVASGDVIFDNTDNIV